MQAESHLVVEPEQYQSDLQVRVALQNGQVEAPDSQPLTDQSELLLLDRSVIALHCIGSTHGMHAGPLTALQ